MHFFLLLGTFEEIQARGSVAQSALDCRPRQRRQEAKEDVIPVGRVEGRAHGTARDQHGDEANAHEAHRQSHEHHGEERGERLEHAHVGPAAQHREEDDGAEDPSARDVALHVMHDVGPREVHEEGPRADHEELRVEHEGVAPGLDAEVPEAVGDHGDAHGEEEGLYWVAGEQLLAHQLGALDVGQRLGHAAPQESRPDQGEAEPHDGLQGQAAARGV
mmetsp:Transcript_112715/g.318530  ORF Transcript_112715/g.318530 Transcript_112715/m.318530 type:complete len:218 (+) Transcript_112715:617-1270(+)